MASRDGQWQQADIRKSLYLARMSNTLLFLFWLQPQVQNYKNTRYTKKSATVQAPNIHDWKSNFLPYNTQASASPLFEKIGSLYRFPNKIVFTENLEIIGLESWET